MELRQLRYFVAVAETANISKAAKKIFLTQPALSRQIKALESEIGQCLLVRSAHSVTLTPAGEILFREALEIIQHVEHALERVRSSSAGGRLRIGYSPSLATGILSPAVASFTQAHPGTRIELLDLASGEMLAGLEANRIDVAVTATRDGGTRGIKWTPLVRTSWRLAVGAAHPLARKAKVRPADISSEPLLVYRKQDYPEYWDVVMGWLRGHGVRPRIAGEYDGAESLVSAVESGLGVAVVSTRMGNLFPERVRMKVLTATPEPIFIAAGHRVDRAGDKPLAVFVEELVRAAKSLA